MTCPPYIKAKAREMRIERHLSIEEIAERLALPKTTIFGWVRDIPLGRSTRVRIRSQEPQSLSNVPPIGDGKRTKQPCCRSRRLMLSRRSETSCAWTPVRATSATANVASLATSDAAVVVLAATWLRRLSAKQIFCTLRYHADQDLDDLRSFWGNALDVGPDRIRLQSPTAIS